MKKLILVLSAALFLSMGSFVLSSCGSEENTENQEQVTQAVYACPMHCEGDKTYENPGKCPVCGMDLTPVHNDEN